MKIFFFFSLSQMDRNQIQDIVELHIYSMEHKIMAQKIKRTANQCNKLHFITCLRILVSEHAQKCHIDDGIYRIQCSHST